MNDPEDIELIDGEVGRAVCVGDPPRVGVVICAIRRGTVLTYYVVFPGAGIEEVLAPCCSAWEGPIPNE